MKRYFGLLVSEWVTAIMIVLVVGAVGFGFYVGDERDAMVAKADETLAALTELAEAADEAGRLLRCDADLLPAAVLDNPFLPLELVAVPLDPKDLAAGYAPALVVDVRQGEVPGDTWDTAQRWFKALKKAQGGGGDEAAAESDPTDPGEVAVATGGGDLGEPDGKLRVAWNWKRLLRFTILAVEAPVCDAPAPPRG